MRRLIYSQGEDGEQLLGVFDEREKIGLKTISNEQSRGLAAPCPKVAQFNRAMLSALLNYTSGVARGMVEYGVANGLDVWRRFFHRYMPLADDLQQVLMQELYSLTLVTETGVYALFNTVEKILELYARHGRAEDTMPEKWTKAVVPRNLPTYITKDLAVPPIDVKTIDGVRNIINVYMHDYQTDTPRGQPGPMLCAAYGEFTEDP